MTDNDGRLHLICERDVGLFSLIQQVIATIPWALAEGRTPIVHFGPRTCYWTPNGHHSAKSVWEYYFEPLHRSLTLCNDTASCPQRAFLTPSTTG